MKSTVMAMFILLVPLALIGGAVYRQPESANGGDTGAGASVLTSKAVADASLKPGRFRGQEGYERRFG